MIETLKLFSHNSLDSHTWVYIGDKPFKCDCCTNIHGHDNLKRHIKICTGQKPFKCKVFVVVIWVILFSWSELCPANERSYSMH